MIKKFLSSGVLSWLLGGYLAWVSTKTLRPEDWRVSDPLEAALIGTGLGGLMFALFVWARRRPNRFEPMIEGFYLSLLIALPTAILSGSPVLCKRIAGLGVLTGILLGWVAVYGRSWFVARWDNREEK